MVGFKVNSEAKIMYLIAIFLPISGKISTKIDGVAHKILLIFVPHKNKTP